MIFLKNYFENLSAHNYFEIIFKWINIFCYNFICFISNHDFYVINFWMHYTFFIIIILRRKTIIVIVNWVFHVSDFLRSFMMSFKFGLFYEDIPQLVVFYFHHSYVCMQYNYYSRSCLLWLVYNGVIDLFHTQKDF